MDYWIDTNRTFAPGPKFSLPLVHITQHWETLELILNEGFKPSYCTEYITNYRETKAACFPMISLSNMSIENAIQTQKSYGTLGIALNKEWGQENDFNPVLYLERKSDLTNEIVEAFKFIKATTQKEILDTINGTGNGHRHLLTRSILKTFAHSKNYDGQLVRNRIELDKAYPFGLEREWRKIIKDEHIPYFLAGDEINKKQDYNNRLSEIRIDFLLEHLVGIIVESDWQLNDVKEIIIEKYQLTEFPSHIKIYINGTRHVPDE